MAEGTWVKVADLSLESEAIKEHIALLDADTADLHPISAIAGLNSELTAIKTWAETHANAENPHNFATNEEYLLGVGPPTISGVFPQKYLDTTTGDTYRYVSSTVGGGGPGFQFNGERYANLSATWGSLGDNSIYAKAEYTGSTGLIPSFPVSSIGLGYTGTVLNLKLIDSAPIQDTPVCVGNNERYFDLEQYISLTGTFDISFNWKRMDAAGSSIWTAIMGDRTAPTLSMIYALDNHSIRINTSTGTLTVTNVLNSAGQGKHLTVQITRSSTNAIVIKVDGVIKTPTTPPTLAGSLKINSFGTAGIADEYLNTDSALNGIKITDHVGRIWDFPLNEGEGTTFFNANQVTNKLGWFTNSQIYSNRITSESLPTETRQGILYSSSGEESGKDMANTWPIPGTNPVVRSGYYTSGTGAADNWRYSIPPGSANSNPTSLTNAEYNLLSNRILHKNDPLCGPTYAGTRASDGGAFAPLVGDYVHRAFWGGHWSKVGSAQDKLRSEMNTPSGNVFNYGEEWWWGWAVWIPNTPQGTAQVNFSGVNNHVSQWHPAGEAASWIRGIQIRAGRWMCGFGGGPQTIIQGDIGLVKQGQWNKFVLHCNMQTDGTGFAHIWLNATDESETPIYTTYANMSPIATTGTTINYKFGVYTGFVETGGAPVTENDWVCYYYDEFRFGQVIAGRNDNPGFKDVLPGG